MTYSQLKNFLLSIYFFVALIAANSAFSQSDAQGIVDTLRAGDMTLAQTYMDRISEVDANRLQCRLLINFNYIFDYDSDLFNRENMAWLLDGLENKGYSWPSNCATGEQESEALCLIYGSDLSPNQANLLKEVFEGLLSCPSNNLACIDINNHYFTAGYTDIYLYVVERYLAEANPADLTRSNCLNYNSWAEAIMRTHTGYFNLGWDIFSDFQLKSGAESLQKSLTGMQQLVNIDGTSVQEEYNFQLQNLLNTDSAGARGKYRILISVLEPFAEL